MLTAEDYRNERLDHLGIVAGVCKEIGLAQYLDAQAPSQQRVVSYGTATVAIEDHGHRSAFCSTSSSASTVSNDPRCR